MRLCGPYHWKPEDNGNVWNLPPNPLELMNRITEGIHNFESNFSKDEYTHFWRQKLFILKQRFKEKQKFNNKSSKVGILFPGELEVIFQFNWL